MSTPITDKQTPKAKRKHQDKDKSKDYNQRYNEKLVRLCSKIRVRYYISRLHNTNF